MKNENNLKYFNKKQLRFALAKQKMKVWVGGRGSGKSSIIALIFYFLAKQLPRGKTAFVCKDLRQAKTKSLAAITDILENVLGLKEDLPNRPGHYRKFKKPPAHWLRKNKPFQMPEMWDNCITFSTGHIIEFVSMYQKLSSNGGSYDAMIADEATHLDEQRFWSEFFIMNRAPSYKHKNPKTKKVPHIHQSIYLLGSMPWHADGMWVPDLEEAAKLEPAKIFYIESTGWDNIHILGKEYLMNLKKTLPSLVYDVEVMNKRCSKIANCFYTHFGIHNKYRNNKYGIDEYYDQHDEIDLSWDFQSGFECCVVMQEKNHGLYFLNEFFGNENVAHTVEDVCVMFDQIYKGHKKKRINLWGDGNGLKSKHSKKSYYARVTSKLEELDWVVTNHITINKNPYHADKFLLAQKLMNPETKGCPKLMFNQDRCPYTIISMELAPVINDNEKDKTSEKKMTNRKYSTHLSDASDYGWYWRYKHLLNSNDGLFGFNPIPKSA